jgi:hypothetical protein
MFTIRAPLFPQSIHHTCKWGGRGRGRGRGRWGVEGECYRTVVYIQTAPCKAWEPIPDLQNIIPLSVVKGTVQLDYIRLIVEVECLEDMKNIGGKKAFCFNSPLDLK